VTVTASEVRSAQFREKLRGYAPDDVDAALEAIAAKLDRGETLRRSDVEALEFGTRLRGYHPQDVDAFIDRLRQEAR